MNNVNLEQYELEPGFADEIANLQKQIDKKVSKNAVERFPEFADTKQQFDDVETVLINMDEQERVSDSLDLDR